eukprot:TRINITY_DN4639_c0_g1_i4.p1 TRINITY_DN4639_c0_g1~~TRINITY_DN4639_c0_g1_i4.p1  ORF type:complete len:270 (+),score=47.40 TRINITY_DN4639_c0_g1_i4:148-957(+)
MGCVASEPEANPVAMVPPEAPKSGKQAPSDKTPPPVMTAEEEVEMERTLSEACPPAETMMRAAVKMMRHLKKARAQIKLNHSQVAEPLRESPRFTSRAAGFERTSSREEIIMEGVKLLDERLKNHEMRAEHMKDDGNCQFRALSHQMYGDQNRHAEVRAYIMEHIKSHKDEYELYCDEDINRYIDRMGKDRTWGDELTLKAAVDAYQATVHAVTSNKDNWHLVYKPEGETTPKPDPVSDASRKKLFLAYISPVHYNSLVPLPTKKTAAE